MKDIYQTQERLEMSVSKRIGNVVVMPGTRTFDFLESKDPQDQKKAKQLVDFCFKAAACGYEAGEMVKLRQQYKDVV